MNPFEILGIGQDASQEEIKAAYRRLAREYHPDSNPKDQNAAEKMHEINQAYQMLRESKEQEEDGASWDIFGYSFKNAGTPEEYRPSRFAFFRNPIFQRIILILLILSMVGISVITVFFQAIQF